MDGGKIGKIELAFLETFTKVVVDNSYKFISLEKISLIKSDKNHIIQFWGNYLEYQFYKENNDTANSEAAKNQLLTFKQTISKNLWKSLQIE